MNLGSVTELSLLLVHQEVAVHVVHGVVFRRVLNFLAVALVEEIHNLVTLSAA